MTWLRRRIAIAAVALLPLAGAAAPDGTPITYVEQPTGIPLDIYVKAWPALEPQVARLNLGSRQDVKADLARLAATDGATDGALNLLAQLDREDGALDEAAAFADYDRSIAENIFKLNSFLAAGDLALAKHDYPRAKAYFEWAVRCRPDSPRTRAGLARYQGASAP